MRGKRACQSEHPIVYENSIVHNGPDDDVIMPRGSTVVIGK